MATIADYTVVQDTAVTLPGAAGDIDFDYPKFDVPAVAADKRSILGLRINPSGTATLQVTLNGTTVLTQLFDTEPQRSWHEIVESNLLTETDNVLTISRTSGSGSLTVSDVYLMFQAVVS